MITDITNRDDIQKLLVNFYTKVREDGLIGYIFDDIAKVNWDDHLPVICDFWEGVLFNKNIYKGNPLQTHLNLNQLVKLDKKHFDRWLALFIETADQLFKGGNCELIKQRANSIATVIQIKIAASEEKKDNN